MATFTVTNTNNSGAGSLRQAISDANALTGRDIIKFGGLFNDAIADTINLTGSSLTIKDNLTIQGTDASLLSIIKNAASRVFDIRNGVSAAINGLTITNSYSSEGGGGAISNSGVLTLSNSNVIGNTADNGGGIYNSGNLTLNSSKIIGNDANERGGGIYNSGTLTVNNSTISSNNAIYDGAGIYNDGNLTVNYSTISGNEVANYDNNNYYPSSGGGIYNTTFGTIDVNNSSITSNHADQASGGGIYNSGILTVSYTTITNNNADDTSFEVGGGGIYNDGTLTVRNSTISNNTGYFGGGIYNQGTLTVRNANIRGNNASYGGGIYNVASATVIGSTISDNVAGGESNSSGGGIYNNGTLILSNDTISNNDGGYYGGGIANGFGYGEKTNGTASVTNSIISGNKAVYIGGGIYNNNVFTLKSSTVSDNDVGTAFFSDGRGGGIFNGDTFTAIASIISGNEVTSDGGGIYNTDGILKLINTTISGNKAIGSFSYDYYEGFGGGIYNNDGTVTLYNSTISGNSAYYGGGGIYNNDGTITVGNSTIVLNTAYDREKGKYNKGGGIYNLKGTAKIKNSIIAGNNKSATNPINPDVVGKFASNGYNLIGRRSGSTGFNSSEELKVAIAKVIDLKLKNNGGLVKTHALVAGSPAINSGRNQDVPSDTTDLDSDGNTTEPIPFDQRGIGFRRISGKKVDIGAFELA
ncbi:MAG: choice-of-anchor Q domain-containing protein [Nostoc sp. ChiSLP02]|nr:choice-of-anchor Q domain-containing protein [Nostoc sp. DedSLP05]MDZ8099120.1 choice-of-anchor Q domain-containing protein [Nostoc sp. DedSLP01]MDZ8185463.1 choice-of-anchor Q domain-containing protein [Nostoc sp. ChiSLP02]